MRQQHRVTRAIRCSVRVCPHGGFGPRDDTDFIMYARLPLTFTIATLHIIIITVYIVHITIRDRIRLHGDNNTRLTTVHTRL